MTRRGWVWIAGLLLIVVGLLLPRDWYDQLPRARGAPPPPIKGVTLLQATIVVDGLLLCWLGFRRPRFDRIPDADRPQFTAPAAESMTLPVPRAAAAWSVAGLTLLALALRLYRVESDLWLDEITPLFDYGSLSYLQVIATYSASNNHLLNTLLMKLSVAVFGEHESAVRLPAVILGTLTIPVLYRVARLASTRLVSLAAALLLAMSYHHIFFSQNARGYAGHMLFSLAATLFLVRALKEDRVLMWSLFGVATFLNIAVLLHGAFVLAAHAIIAVGWIGYSWRANGRPTALLKRLCLVLGITGYATFHLYATALPQAYAYITTAYAEAESGYTLLSLEFAREIAQGLAQAVPGRVLIAAFPAAIVGALGWLMLLRRHWLLTASLTLPLALIALTLIAGGLTFTPRFFLLALPLSMVCGVEGLFGMAHVFSGERRRVATIAATVLVVLGAAGALLPLRRYYAVPKQPYRQAINYVESVRGSGVIIVAHLAEAGYRYYATRQGLVENRDFFVVRSVKALDNVLASHPNRAAYVVTTLSRFLHVAEPELEARISAGWVEDRTFPATIGNGDITVWRPGGVFSR
jgi:mannosyltransferase